LQKYMVHKFFLQNHTFSAVEDAVPPALRTHAAQNQISNQSDRLDRAPRAGALAPRCFFLLFSFILFYSTKFFPT
jgi:hypothetical protein